MSSLQGKTATGAAQSSATVVLSSPPLAQAASSSSSLRNLKGSMTLPLQSSVNGSNNLTHIRGLTPLGQLNSPDLRNLGLPSSGVTSFLNTPDFEKLVSQSLTVGITPTSAGGNAPQTPSTFLNPKYVTEEEEQFVLNFDEKIKSMIKKEREGGVDENQLNTPVMMDISGPYAGTVTAASAATASTGSVQPPVLQQQQPQPEPAMFTVSSSSALSLPSAGQVSAVVATNTIPASSISASAASTLHQGAHPSSYASDSDDPMETSCSPGGASGSGGRQLDMTEQEQLKLERKRQRNRDAARKCRERKLERIRFLEERVAELKSQNSRLQRTAVDLREQVKTLQHVIVEHTKRGCSLKDSLTAKLGLA